MEQNSDDRVVGTSDVDMNNSVVAFDNLTILRELGNISNLVRESDFLGIVPQVKLRRLKWLQMFNCLKQGILDDMMQEVNSMWEQDGMREKLEILEKQKEKFSETHANKTLWRPQLGNVKGQLKAHDVANLRKQKSSLESLVKEYEVKVTRIKKRVSARRGYIKAQQLDIQKYKKKSEDVIEACNRALENQICIADIMAPPKTDIDNVIWSEKEMITAIESERDRT